ncbi:alkaline phosphatase family protein [Mucilaginibacter roseus]|uniref:Alkaline phosphatase family protein n=1 Tax=Mucilaginibacter roseus TaxID=1528868 RepID=A0ABS8U328_9SPHI|nr:alkaline phosphatase family protein [Mucilaginibacter roseus]MCD8741536.1 alkaline phosphatase family protein [Mucilaginibacter roseus]
MKKIIAIAALVFVAGMASAQKKKAIFIIIDGVSKDVIEEVETPNLHAIAKEGTLLSAYQGGEKGQFNQTPTISAPGYTNVLTGVWFHKHNVPDNDIKAPNYHYPTIFRFFKDQYPAKKTAVFSSWQDNRTKLVGEGLPQTGNIKLDHHFDGLELDTLKYPHDKGRKFMADIDQAVVDDAVKTINRDAPDLSWVYLEYTDDMGHMYGDSEQFYDAVRAADRRVGQLWEAIKQRKAKYKEDWLIVVTTDHGRDPKTGRGHGGQTDRERASWIATNAQPLNSYARQANQVAVVDILPTIARFVNIKLSADQQRELDGVPLIGKVSLSQPQAVKADSKINLTWTAQNSEGKVKVWLATTNNFKQTGKADAYKLVGEVPVSDGKFVIDLTKVASSNIYKVVLEGQYNTVNRWVVNK